MLGAIDTTVRYWKTVPLENMKATSFYTGLDKIMLRQAAPLHLHPDPHRVLGHRDLGLLLGVPDTDHGLADDGAGAS